MAPMQDARILADLSMYIYLLDARWGAAAPHLARVECPTLNSAKPQNIDVVDNFEDIELRGALQL